MALVDILMMSDTDVKPTSIAVGSVVKPVDFYDKDSLDKSAWNNEILPNLTYGYAIVVSLSPFTLVSEDAGHRWLKTNADLLKFYSVGRCKPDPLALAMTRLSE